MVAAADGTAAVDYRCSCMESGMAGQDTLVVVELAVELGCTAWVCSVLVVVVGQVGQVVVAEALQWVAELETGRQVSAHEVVRQAWVLQMLGKLLMPSLPPPSASPGQL